MNAEGSTTIETGADADCAHASTNTSPMNNISAQAAARSEASWSRNFIIAMPLVFAFYVCNTSEARLTTPVNRRLMKKDTPFSLRMPASLKSALGREAKEDQRSIASLIIKVLTDRYKQDPYKEREAAE
jgi:hypothetical protein